MSQTSSEQTTQVGDTGGEQVRIRIPADAAYVAVLRTAAAGLAARLDFTVDEIEDLRIAVNEACALLLPNAVAGADVRASFELTGGALVTSVAVLSAPATPPREGTFAWTVLSALVDTVTTEVDDGDVVTVVLRKERGAASSGSVTR